MLFSLTSGAIADNFNRRRVMLVAQVVMLLVSAGLTAATYLGIVTPWMLLGFTFLIGCGTALNNPSWQASVGDIVPRADLPAAVALNSVNFNITRSVGPAIGGAIVAAGGAAAAFAVNTVSYLALMAVLFRWKPDLPASSLPREALWSAMTAGLRYVAMSPNIEKVLLRSFVFGFTTISILALLPLVARDLPNGGPLLYGVMLGAFGCGAIGGAFLSSRLRKLTSAEWIVRSAFVGFALCGALVATAWSAVLACLALAVGGASWVLALSLFNVTVQLSTPRWVVGRALATLSDRDLRRDGARQLGLGRGGGGLWGGAGAAGCGGHHASRRRDRPRDRAAGGDDAQPRSAQSLEGTAAGTGPQATQRPDRDHDRVHDPRGGHGALPRGHGRATAGARTQRRAQLDALPRPGKSACVDGDLPPSHLGRVSPAQFRTTYADQVVADRIRALHSGSEPPRVHRMIERPTSWSDTLFATRSIFELP